MGIPVFGIVDTNSDPSNIDFVIPANDDAAKSVEVILDACCSAINEGIEERKVEKADAEAAAQQPDEAPKMRHRSQKARVESKEEAPANDAPEQPAAKEAEAANEPAAESAE